MCYKCKENPEPTKQNPENILLEKRAKAKYLSNSIISELLLLNSKMRFSYANTLKCGNVCEVENGQVKTIYCKNRFCLVCSRIDVATKINKYDSFFKENFQEPFHVVLSKRSIKRTTAQNLRSEVQKYLKELKQIIDNYRKQHGIYQAIAKVEITYNNLKDSYHTHFHVLCESKTFANFILDKWLKKNPSKALRDKGNKAFPLNFTNDSERRKALKEMFKYTVKPISDLLNSNAKKGKAKSTVKKNGKYVKINGNSVNDFVHLQALDLMYQAIKKLRCLRVYGIKLKEIEKIETETFEETELLRTKTTADSGTYIWQKDNWYNRATGEPLTEYVPGKYEKNIIRFYQNYWKFAKKRRKKRQI